MANRRHEILVLVAAMAMTVGCSDDGGATGGTGNSPDLGSAGGGAIVDWGVGTPTHGGGEVSGTMGPPTREGWGRPPPVTSALPEVGRECPGQKDHERDD